MRRHLWWLLGLALVGGGLAVALSAPSAPSDFGWFAYTPPSGGSDWQMGWEGTHSAVVVSRGQLVGVALGTLGLLVLAARAGFHHGRRRAPRP